MNNQEKFAARPNKLKVRRTNLKTISLYPVRFSTDIFFSSLVSFAFVVAIFCFTFFSLKIYISDTHLTMRAGEE